MCMYASIYDSFGGNLNRAPQISDRDSTSLPQLLHMHTHIYMHLCLCVHVYVYTLQCVYIYMYEYIFTLPQLIQGLVCGK